MSIGKVTAPVVTQTEQKAVDRVSAGAPQFSTDFSALVDLAAKRTDVVQDRRAAADADKGAARRTEVQDRPRPDMRSRRDDRVKPKDRPADQKSAADKADAAEKAPVADDGASGEAAPAANSAPSSVPSAERQSADKTADPTVPDAVAAVPGIPVNDPSVPTSVGLGFANAAVQQADAATPDSVTMATPGQAAGVMPGQTGEAVPGQIAGAATGQAKSNTQPHPQGKAAVQNSASDLSQAAAAALASASAAASPAGQAKPGASAASAQAGGATQPLAAGTSASPQAAALAALLPTGETVKVQTAAADTASSASSIPSGQLLRGGDIFALGLANGGGDASQTASGGGGKGGGASGDAAQQAQVLAQAAADSGRVEMREAAEKQVFSSLLNAQLVAEPPKAATGVAGATGSLGDPAAMAMPVSSTPGLSSTTAAGQAQMAQPARPQPAVPLHDQIGVHMVKAAKEGTSRINIELNPLELGKIEVRLDMAQDGRVVANIIADNSDTLTMLQQDAQALQRSLQDAGLQADSGSLNFHLRGQERQFSQAEDGRRGHGGSRNMAMMDNSDAAPVAATSQESLTADGGLDIRI